MGIMDELGAGIGEDDGTYDIKALQEAKESLKDVSTENMKEVEPVDIEVVPHSPEEIHHTDELEARVVVISYDRFDNPLRVEIL